MYRQHTFEYSGSILNSLKGLARGNLKKLDLKKKIRKEILTAEKNGRKAVANTMGKIKNKIKKSSRFNIIKENILLNLGRKIKPPKKQQLKKSKPLSSTEILGKILERLSSIEGLLTREVRTNDALRKYNQSVNIIKNMTEQKRLKAKRSLQRRLKNRREARKKLKAVQKGI